MIRTMAKSKLHRATVTQANLNYMGSITISTDLMEAADLLPYEKVQIVNCNNGARFETYVIEGQRGAGDICLNGAAARLVHPGDKVIIISYGMFDAAELCDFKPKMVFLDDHNRVVGEVPNEPAHTVPEELFPGLHLA